TPASSAKTRFFRSRDSGTASTTRSASAAWASASATVRRPRAAAIASRRSLPFSAARSQDPSIASLSRERAAGCVSKSPVAKPESADSEAIPRPMVPPPTTKMRSIFIARIIRMELRDDRGAVAPENLLFCGLGDRQGEEVVHVLLHRGDAGAREVGAPDALVRELRQARQGLEELLRRDAGELEGDVAVPPSQEDGPLHLERPAGMG